MDLKQNTEFILTKIDSLMRDAMPYLEKGSEEVIKYQVIKFRMEFIVFGLIFLFLSIICGITVKKLWSRVDEPSSEGWAYPIVFISAIKGGQLQ